METNKIQIKTLIISLVAIVCIEVGMRFMITKGLNHQMIILGVSRLLEIIFLILIIQIWGKGISSIGLAQSRVFFGFKKGLIWSAAFGIVTFFAFVVLFFVGINGLEFINANLPQKPVGIILFFFIGGMVGPIAEEIFFRGILYGFFRRWGVLVALVLSILIFVLAHPNSHRVLLTQVVGGFVFTVAYEIEESLIAPITIHVLGNIAIFTLSLIS